MFINTGITAGEAFAEIKDEERQRQTESVLETVREAVVEVKKHGAELQAAEIQKQVELQAAEIQKQADKDHDVGFIMGTLYATVADLVGIAKRTAEKGWDFFRLTAMTTYPRNVPEKEKFYIFNRKAKRAADRAAGEHDAFGGVLAKDFINLPECREFYKACNDQGVGVSISSQGDICLKFGPDAVKQSQTYERALMTVAMREWQRLCACSFCLKMRASLRKKWKKQLKKHSLGAALTRGKKPWRSSTRERNTLFVRLF